MMEFGQEEIRLSRAMEKLSIENGFLRTEIERLHAHQDALGAALQGGITERDKLRADVEGLRAALKPLLDHYLSCYDGNKDALAIEAERLLGSALEQKADSK